MLDWGTVAAGAIGGVVTGGFTLGATALREHWENDRRSRDRREARMEQLAIYKDDTMVELQDSLSDFLTAFGEANTLDVDAAKSGSKPPPLSSEFEQRAGVLSRRVRVLASRLDDSLVRSTVDEIMRDWNGYLLFRASEFQPERTRRDAEQHFDNAGNAAVRLIGRLGELLSAHELA